MANIYTITVLPDSIDTSALPSAGVSPGDKIDLQVGGGRTDSPDLSILQPGTTNKKTPLSPPHNPISVPSHGTSRHYTVNPGACGEYTLSVPTFGPKLGTATGTLKVNN